MASLVDRCVSIPIKVANRRGAERRPGARTAQVKNRSRLLRTERSLPMTKVMGYGGDRPPDGKGRWCPSLIDACPSLSKWLTGEAPSAVRARERRKSKIDHGYSEQSVRSP